MEKKAKALTPDEVTERTVKLLFDQNAPGWTVQQKGAFLAAVKLRLQREKAGE